MEAADGDNKLPVTGTVAPTLIRTALIPGLFQFLRIETEPKSAGGLSMQRRPAKVGNWRMEACAAPNLSRRFAQGVGLIWTWMKALELEVRGGDCRRDTPGPMTGRRHPTPTESDERNERIRFPGVGVVV